MCWLAGGHKWRTQREALDEGVDLVVATPGRLAEHIKGGTLKLAQCQAVVLDEADVLLGDAFAFAQQARPCPEAWCHLHSAQRLHATPLQAVPAKCTQFSMPLRLLRTKWRRSLICNMPPPTASFSKQLVMLALGLFPAFASGFWTCSL